MQKATGITEHLRMPHMLCALTGPRCLKRGGRTRGCQDGRTIARLFALCCVLAACLCAAATVIAPKGHPQARTIDRNSKGLSAAKTSRRDATAWSSSQRTASQGVLRLRGRTGGKRQTQAAVLEGLLDSYTEMHKRCLFDDAYQGQYVIVSMSDSFSGEKPTVPTRLSYSCIAFGYFLDIFC